MAAVAEVERDELEATRRRRYAAETLATFVYVFIGAGTESLARIAQVRAHRPATSADWLAVALAHGFALATITFFARRISGAHVNPAVTVALATLGRFAWRGVAPQLVAQFLGGTLGAVGVLIVLGRNTASTGLLGAPLLAPDTSLLQGCAIEALGAAILTITIVATARDPRAPLGWASLAVGMAVASQTMFMGPATTSLLNPARAFGPVLVDTLLGIPSSWAAYVVCYLIGPVLGALVGCHLYDAIALLSEEPRTPLRLHQRGRS